MEIHVQQKQSITLIEISGHIDSTNASQLGAAFNEQIESQHYQLIADFSKVEYISSAGLRELVAALKRVRSNKGDLRLASLGEHVEQVLTIAGLNAIFQIFPSQAEAVGSY